jgi:aldehyde dehydrogenase (NAD+)
VKHGPLITSQCHPVTGKVITAVSGGTSKDVDIAVDIAKKAFKSSWGFNVPGKERGRLMYKLVDLMEQHKDELAALEVLNLGQ